MTSETPSFAGLCTNAVVAQTLVGFRRAGLIEDHVIARSTEAAIWVVRNRPTLPSFVSFDHDLGGDDTAMKFLRYLERYGYCDQPPFDYQIHSQNPVGRDNIRSFMESWQRFHEPVGG